MYLQDVVVSNRGLAGLPFRVKCLYLAPSFLWVFISKNWEFQVAVMLFFFFFTLRFAQVALGRLLKIYAIPFFFILSGCLVLVVTLQPENMWLKMEPFPLGIDKNGVQQAIAVFCRSLALYTVIVPGMLTCSISEISELFRKLRVPELFIELFILSYKFIGNLLFSTQSIYTAQKCRLAYQGNGKKLHHFSMLFSAVFRQAIGQANQLNDAVLARNANDGLRFTRKRKEFSLQQLVGPVLICLGLLTIHLTLACYA